MDKVCKKILDKMISAGEGTEYWCSFITSSGNIFIEDFAKDIEMNSADVRAAMSYLVKEGYLTYEMGVPNPMGVHLSYTGLKWRESYYKSILKYIADKWTDIIASIISLISLILSIIALNKR